MPARIDPEHRRRMIVDAAFRLVLRDGMEGLSLRKVAVEAELNIGSVRHYFTAYEELLAAAATEAGDRMGRRLTGHLVAERPVRLPGETSEGASPSRNRALEKLRHVVEEILPLDEARQAEAVVVTEFIMASRTRPVFAANAAQMAEDLLEVLRQALETAGVQDVETVARQLSALIGGLTMDAITPHGGLGPRRVREILSSFLDRLPLADG